MYAGSCSGISYSTDGLVFKIVLSGSTNTLNFDIENAMPYNSSLIESHKHWHKVSSKSVIREYERVCTSDGSKNIDLLDKFLKGLACYLYLVHINNIESDQLPFSLPFKQSNFVNRNHMLFVSHGLSAILRSSSKNLIPIILDAGNFINLWSHLFVAGPEIPVSDYTLMTISTFDGLSRSYGKVIDDLTLKVARLENKMREQEERHKSDMINLHKSIKK